MENSSVGIIGGADGPTKIFIYGNILPEIAAVLVIAAIIAAVVVILKKKRAHLRQSRSKKLRGKRY